MPTCAQSECLALTYQRLPGSSPTSTVPSPGWCPAAVSAATRSVISVRIAAAVALPSRIVAGTPDSVPDAPEISGGALPALRSQGGRTIPSPADPPEERHERARTDPLPVREPVRAGRPGTATRRRRVLAGPDDPGAEPGGGKLRGRHPGGLGGARLCGSGRELLHDPAVLDAAGQDP